MRAAGIETFGGEVQILELAAPQSLAPDEVVIAVRAAGVGNWDEIVRAGAGMSAASARLCSGSRRPASSSPLAKR
jgi:NADPH:quinone reductase-like Zn-dependent oxidoreductase